VTISDALRRFREYVADYERRAWKIIMYAEEPAEALLRRDNVPLRPAIKPDTTARIGRSSVICRLVALRADGELTDRVVP
jgi:hypothetical protein